MTTFSVVGSWHKDTQQNPDVALSGLTAGNYIIACFSQWRGSYTADHTISDTNTGSWTKLEGHDSEMGNSSYRHSMSIWGRPVTSTDASSGPTITCVGPSNDSCALTVFEVEASASFDYTFEDAASGTSGTSDWDGTSSGNTSSISGGNDILEVAVGFGRISGATTDPTAAGLYFDTQTDDKTTYIQTLEMAHVYAIEASGQADGVKSATINADGSGYPGITAVLAFSTAGGGTSTNVDLAYGSYTQTGNALGITFERNVDLGAGSYALTGYDITVSYTTPVALDAGSYTVTGYDLALTFDRAVALDAGTYTLTGNALGLTFDTAVDLDAGSYTVTGYDLSIQTGTGVSLDAGSYTVTGYDLGITFVRAVDLAAGSYTVTGYDLSIELAGVTNVSLDAGSYTVSGYDLTIPIDRAVDLGAGSYTLTGNDIDIPLTRAVDLDAGSYTVTGYDLTIDVDQPVAVDLDAGSLTLTGYPLGINVVSLSTQQPGGWLPRRRIKPIIYVDEDGNPVDITAPVEEAIEAAPEAKQETIRKAVERVTEQTKAPTIKAVGRAIQRIDAAAFKRFYEAEKQRADDDDVAAILLLAA